MRYENVGDILVLERALQRQQMFRDIRPGIDHGNIVIANHVNTSALEGERAGIGRENAMDQRRNRKAFAEGHIEIPLEGNTHQAPTRNA